MPDDMNSDDRSYNFKVNTFLKADLSTKIWKSIQTTIVSLPIKYSMFHSMLECEF